MTQQSLHTVGILLCAGSAQRMGFDKLLTPIVGKLSDMRVVNAELENLVFAPRKEFITMAVLVLANIPLVRFINTDWYHTLVDTIPGQIVIAICIAAVFVSFAFVVKLTQPIEYRR